jgi:hypothetical protein
MSYYFEKRHQCSRMVYQLLDDPQQRQHLILSNRRPLTYQLLEDHKCNTLIFTRCYDSEKLFK